MKSLYFLCCGLIACAVWPFSVLAEEPRLHLRDDEAGYVVLLPDGWREVTDPLALKKLLDRVGVLFAKEGVISGASHIRGAVFADDARAAPALAVFALDYAGIGLTSNALDEMARDTRRVGAALADAMQVEYLKLFPQTVLVNSVLGEDYFYMHLRSVLDPADEQGSTRNRYIKLIFGAHVALMVLAQYDGPQNINYELALAKSTRESTALPEKKIRTRLPPYEASFLDYLMLVAAVIFGVYCFGRLRAWMRS